jgi:uncharacterized metal-binding protein YceD (DUF177 family)
MVPEFSRPLRLTGAPRDLTLAATPAEGAALARRYAILRVASVTAEVSLRPAEGGRTRLTGRLVAEVTQPCVVSLEPVDQRVDVPLDLVILPEGEAPTDDDPESPDEIESAEDRIDLGEVLAEQLALALDPYPRAPGATLPAEVTEPEAPAPAPTRLNPFAALARRGGG